MPSDRATVHVTASALHDLVKLLKELPFAWQKRSRTG
jgi:hypothetical protein